MGAGGEWCVFYVEEGNFGAGDNAKVAGEACVNFKDVERPVGGLVAGKLGCGSTGFGERNVVSDAGHAAAGADPDHIEREAHLLHPECLDAFARHEEEHAGVAW